MKKLTWLTAIALLFWGYSQFERTQTAATLPVTPDIPTPTPTRQPAPATGRPIVPTLTLNPVSNPTATPAPVGQYKDGEYTGSVADAFYGNIQVKTVVSGGKITDVQFLQYPNDRSTSIAINSQAMPILKAEAIQAQSANVDIVSGATDSSHAFIESLTSTLAQAHR